MPPKFKPDYGRSRDVERVSIQAIRKLGFPTEKFVCQCKNLTTSFHA